MSYLPREASLEPSLFFYYCPKFCAVQTVLLNDTSVKVKFNAGKYA